MACCLSTPLKKSSRKGVKAKNKYFTKKRTKMRLKELFTMLFVITTTKTVFLFASIVAKGGVSNYYNYICVSRFLIPFKIENPVCISVDL